MKKRVPIKEWKKDERPREKLLEKGPEALTDAELIAILIASGTKKESALDISRNILTKCDNNLRELAKIDLEKLKEISGVGPTKAVTLLSVLELFKRFTVTSGKEMPKIQSSDYAAKAISPLLRDLPHEECWVLYLNRANKLISKERLSIGGVSSTVVDVKIIIRNALAKLASGLILVHNHPSGNASPGENDKIQTKILKDAASLFDIALLDHLIIAGDRYFSFADDGMI
ncbi:MAG: DNA repair protein RadC [Bacteroidales bacterium]|nr:DNA repair protein RadC [Bacteroidales bacterium]MDD4656010.1 DNA repair protein RadC [Bacteroidales bacterium]